MNTKIILDRICNLCEENNISKNQMLSNCGLKKSVVDNLKREKPSMPSAEKVAKIADYFNVSTDYLLGKTEVRNYEETARKCMLRTPEEEQELNEYLEQVHNDPNLRMMFKLTKGATKADVEKAVEIIKTLLGK